MTNFEFYKDKILEIGFIDRTALNKQGEIAKCSHVSCSCCEFGGKGGCLKAKLEWLYEEHVEKPKPHKLTKKERKFCELVEKGYIARDEGESLYVYASEPRKCNYCWECADCNVKYADLDELNDVVPLKFDFIKWEDKEPWSVEDLLKMEVE